MRKLIFHPISEWHITNCKSETDDRKYIVKILGHKDELFIRTGTEIMTDMADGQFIFEFAMLEEK